MGFLDTPRVPEPPRSETERVEAERHASPDALRHLEALDDELVDRAVALGAAGGSVVDLGTGTGQIPIKLALRDPEAVIHAVDLSDAMLRRAAMDAGQWGVGLRILFDRCDATALPFDAGLFDLVLCDGLLHEVPDPARLIREMDRIAVPGGALLLRDLRRPNRLEFGAFMKKHARHFTGVLRAEFEESVRAAYTEGEVEAIVAESGVEGLRVTRMGPAHLGFTRPKLGAMPGPARDG
jgi:ubiquinone/menaquinone biosynthesis C-methylase UbiE